jgi:FkbM family methyltransferase
MARWIRSVGWQATSVRLAAEARSALGMANLSTVRMKPRNAQHALVARLGGSSDIDVFAQIFAWEGYACLQSISSPRWILDLGANAGYSSAYLLSRFPAARVIAVEPDPSNYQLCRRNLEPYGERARVIEGAAWSTRSRLATQRGAFGDGREWATQVVASADGTVEGYDIPSLLAMAGGEEIDILKVDIERSELEVFGGSSARWLPAVRNICIELHGPDCREVFLRALETFEYDLEYSGELTICRNLRQKERP